MDLHGRIMNLPDGCGLSEIGTTHGEQLAYKRGHRDARHAAAELSNDADAEIDRLRAELAKSHEPVEDAEAFRLRYQGAVKAIEAAERERCAKLCDEIAADWVQRASDGYEGAYAAENCADAIREA